MAQGASWSHCICTKEAESEKAQPGYESYKSAQSCKYAPDSSL